MFESPQTFSKQGRTGHPAGWEYIDELEAMAEWLTAGPDRSPELAEAVAGMDTFRGTDTVKRWLHNVATAHLPGAALSNESLDRLVEGKGQREGLPTGRAVDIEISLRLAVLESLCIIPDNYRCALLLKEGSGLTVERTARLMGVSKASLRSILYRARRTIDSQLGQSEPQG